MDDVLANLGALSSAWRRAKGLDTSPSWIATKLVEEVGEVARALVGEHERRAGRGDLVQEAAQTVIVLASLLHETHPDANLATAILDEMRRLGAIPPAPDPNQPALFEDTAPGQEPAAVNPLLAGRVTTGASYEYPTIDLPAREG